METSPSNANIDLSVEGNDLYLRVYHAIFHNEEEDYIGSISLSIMKDKVEEELNDYLNNVRKPNEDIIMSEEVYKFRLNDVLAYIKDEGGFSHDDEIDLYQVADLLEDYYIENSSQFDIINQDEYFIYDSKKGK